MAGSKGCYQLIRTTIQSDNGDEVYILERQQFQINAQQVVINFQVLVCLNAAGGQNCRLVLESSNFSVLLAVAFFLD